MERQPEQAEHPEASEAQATEAQATEAQASEAQAAAWRRRVTELEEQALRARADADNLRKRHARELAAVRTEERAQVAAEWLPVLDTLDLALDHAEADPAMIVSGVAAVREQALAVLGRLGFPRRDDQGQRFDPAWHEAVATVAGAQVPAGTVVRVVRPGYGEDGRQLRPAAVVVAREEE